jgi:hypothetical protein
MVYQGFRCFGLGKWLRLWWCLEFCVPLSRRSAFGIFSPIGRSSLRKYEINRIENVKCKFVCAVIKHHVYTCKGNTVWCVHFTWWDEPPAIIHLYALYLLKLYHLHIKHDEKNHQQLSFYVHLYASAESFTYQTWLDKPPARFLLYALYLLQLKHLHNINLMRRPPAIIYLYALHMIELNHLHTISLMRRTTSSYLYIYTLYA